MIRFNYIVLVLAICIYIPIAIINHKNHKYAIQRQILFLFFYLYVCALIDIVFFPIPLPHESDGATRYNIQNLKFANLMPGKTIMLYTFKQNLHNFFTQIIGNILLFTPMGYLLPVFNTKIKNYKKALIYTLTISLSIEVVQLIYAYFILLRPYRQFDIDDLILNTLGGLLGFLALKLTLFAQNKRIRPQN